jgi:hypothetical protein
VISAVSIVIEVVSIFLVSMIFFPVDVGVEVKLRRGRRAQVARRCSDQLAVRVVGW